MKRAIRRQLSGAVLLIACIRGAIAIADVPAPGIPVEQFVVLYCAGCHGPGGQGANPTFPKLAGQQPDYLFREMLKFRSGERKGTIMQVNLASLQNREIAILARYFGSQRRIPDPDPGIASDEAGKALYALGDPARNVLACSRCHDATSHRASPIPRLAGQHAAYIESQLFRFVYGERQVGQAAKHPFADQLEDDEIRSVSRYVSRIE